jgi:hypothetical protein
VKRRLFFILKAKNDKNGQARNATDTKKDRLVSSLSRGIAWDTPNNCVEMGNSAVWHGCFFGAALEGQAGFGGEIMIKYMVQLSDYNVDARISKVEVDSETAKFITIKGRRYAKRSNWENYYDSWVDAYRALENRQEKICAQLVNKLRYSEKRLVEIQKLQEGDK